MNRFTLLNLFPAKMNSELSYVKCKDHKIMLYFYCFDNQKVLINWSINWRNKLQSPSGQLPRTPARCQNYVSLRLYGSVGASSPKPLILWTCFIKPSRAWCSDSGKSRSNCFFPSLQSMRSTDCVKVQTIWIYTSKWSGCTMNMFVICLPSREKCLNIQRECVMSPAVNPGYASLCYLESGHLVLQWLPS